MPTVLEWQSIKLKSSGYKESIREEVQEIQAGLG